MTKYLDDDLIAAVNLIKGYLEQHAPGGSIRLTGDKGSFVLVSQDPDVIDIVNDAFDEAIEGGKYEELVSVTVKDNGEC